MYNIKKDKVLLLFSKIGIIILVLFFGILFIRGTFFNNLKIAKIQFIIIYIFLIYFKITLFILFSINLKIHKSYFVGIVISILLLINIFFAISTTKDIPYLINDNYVIIRGLITEVDYPFRKNEISTNISIETKTIKLYKTINSNKKENAIYTTKEDEKDIDLDFYYFVNHVKERDYVEAVYLPNSKIGLIIRKIKPTPNEITDILIKKYAQNNRYIDSIEKGLFGEYKNAKIVLKDNWKDKDLNKKIKIINDINEYLGKLVIQTIYPNENFTLQDMYFEYYDKEGNLLAYKLFDEYKIIEIE